MNKYMGRLSNLSPYCLETREFNNVRYYFSYKNYRFELMKCMLKSKNTDWKQLAPKEKTKN